MPKLLQPLWSQILYLLRPLFERTLLRRTDKVLACRDAERFTTLSGMVTEFNVWHNLLFGRFFRRVKVLKTDIARIIDASAKGPLVFVMKNRGQLEYRYFNTLFLKEHIQPVVFANNALTIFWRPLREMWRYALARLSEFYAGTLVSQSDEANIESAVRAGKNTLINLSISRDYLFGLIRSNPLNRVKPLLNLQQRLDAPITIVPLQFLYDKHPEHEEKSFSDLLFGEKSRPGGLRKFLLFIMGFRKSPQVKFGGAINLKEFIADKTDSDEKKLTASLNRAIEDNLSIERARVTGPKLKSKEAMIDDIIKDPALIGTLQNLSRDNGEAFEALKNKTRAHLTEIAADVNYSYVHFVWLALNYLWNHIFDGIVVKHDQLNRIRDIAGRYPVILAPMHRSHIDYLLISHIFYAQNITFPHICAGINLNFWPVGRLIRKCGGYFIRRKLDGEPSYKEALYSYIKALITQGYCMEFFIEGTRSRTGKMLKPKLGILSQIARAWSDGAHDDVYFVPIAVNYEQIPEHKAYEAEGKGLDKRKEGAGEILKVRRVLGRKYGKVYVEFDEPLSLKSFMLERGVKPGTPADNMRDDVKELGYHLTYRMNKSAVVTPTALSALAMLSMQRRAFAFEDLIARVKLLREYLDYKRVTYSDIIHYSDRWAFGEALEILKSRGLVREVKSFEGSFYAMEPNQRVRLDYYKNNILHFFVSLSCCAKILLTRCPDKTMTMVSAVKAFERLKLLLADDFTFSSRDPLEEHIRRVLVFLDTKGLVTTDDDFASFAKTAGGDDSLLRAYGELLDNFLEARLVTLRYLRRNPCRSLDAKAILRDMLEKSKPLYLREDLRHPEALNRFCLESSLKFCVAIGLMTVSSPEKDKTLYTTVDSAELIEKWIASLRETLTAIPADTASSIETSPVETAPQPEEKWQ